MFSFVVYFVLPDYPKSPRSATWLTLREQEYLEARLSENAPKTGDAAFDKAEVLASLRNPRTYAFMLSQIPTNLGGYGLSWQLPTVTTSLGFAGLPRNQLLNIPPAAASVLAIIFAGWFMSRAYVTRPAFIMFICGGALVFFIVLATTRDKYAVYIACVFGTMFYSVYFIPFWACKSSFLVCTFKRKLTFVKGAQRHLLAQPGRHSLLHFNPALDKLVESLVLSSSSQSMRIMDTRSRSPFALPRLARGGLLVRGLGG